MLTPQEVSTHSFAKASFGGYNMAMVDEFLDELTDDYTALYKENAARMMTDMLVSVVQEGTGKGLAISEMPCAGKTGTTNDNKDGWFVGYTRYYTTSVWVGYDMPKELPTLKGSSYPGNIWHDFMENISETSHALTLENREHLSLSGISDVDSFNEEEIVAICSCGELTIKGELLHIEELNLETGYVSVSGKVTSLTYSEKFSSSSLLKRLFGG